MLQMDPKEIARSLQKRAEELFGSDRTAEIQPELETMADQLATLRSTPEKEDTSR